MGFSKRSRWRIEKPDELGWAFHPIPTPFLFKVHGYDYQRNKPIPGNWGVGIGFLFWRVELWDKPIPR